MRRLRRAAFPKSTVHRLFQAFAVQPHRPPDHALVLCIDEKSQIQALNRTQPVLPMGLGYAEGISHDYVRNGTRTLFAALDIATGTVFTECKPRHRLQEFLSFLNRLDEFILPDLEVHLIVDNYGTHKDATVRTWLERRPRYQVHCTTKYSSWLNQVERRFTLTTRRAIRRGSFRRVNEQGLCSRTSGTERWLCELNGRREVRSCAHACRGL